MLHEFHGASRDLEHWPICDVQQLAETLGRAHDHDDPRRFTVPVRTNRSHLVAYGRLLHP